MADQQFLTFEETMQRLGLTEDELMDLVFNEQLRSFVRNNGELHFRPDDVAAYAGTESPAEAPTLIPEAGAPQTAAAGESEEELITIEDDGDEDLILMEEEGEDDGVESPPEAEAEITLEEPEEEAEISISEEDEAGFELEPTPESGTGVDYGAVTSADFASLEAESEEEEETEPTLVDQELSLIDEDATEQTVGLGTEEIVFTDDDLDIGEEEGTQVTQQVTVQEDAVDEAGEATVTVAEDALTGTEVLEEEGLGVMGPEEPEAAGAAAPAGPPRVVYVEPEEPPVGVFWYIALAACLVVSVVPFTMLWTVVNYGYGMRQPARVSEVTPDGRLPEYGEVFTPEPLNTFLKKLKPADWWGMPALPPGGTLKQAYLDRLREETRAAREDEDDLAEPPDGDGGTDTDRDSPEDEEDGRGRDGRTGAADEDGGPADEGEPAGTMDDEGDGATWE
jgi:hypothetical protein